MCELTRKFYHAKFKITLSYCYYKLILRFNTLSRYLILKIINLRHHKKVLIKETAFSKSTCITVRKDYAEFVGYADNAIVIIFPIK